MKEFAIFQQKQEIERLSVQEELFRLMSSPFTKRCLPDLGGSFWT